MLKDASNKEGGYIKKGATLNPRCSPDGTVGIWGLKNNLLGVGEKSNHWGERFMARPRGGKR